MGEDDPFLGNSDITNSRNRIIFLIIGGLTVVYVLVSIILLLVYGFSQNTLFPNITMILLLCVLLGHVFWLYKWKENDDTPENFKWIFFFAVFILLLGATVGIIYATSVQGIEECAPCWEYPCGSDQLYSNYTDVCMPNCAFQGPKYYLNSTLLNNETGLVPGNCVQCGDA